MNIFVEMIEGKMYFVELFPRLFAGILFFFQGYDKVFNVKISGVVNTFNEEAGNKHIPHVLVVIASVLTSYIELTGGLLLIIGLYKDYALLFLGFDLLIVSVAFSMVQPMWDTRHVFPRFVLVAGLLLIPASWYRYSFDVLFNLVH